MFWNLGTDGMLPIFRRQPRQMGNASRLSLVLSCTSLALSPGAPEAVWAVAHFS